MSNRLTILFAPMDSMGHINACIGLGEVLQSRGHHIVFMLFSGFKGQAANYGFTEEILEKPSKSNDSESDEQKNNKQDEESQNEMSLEEKRRRWDEAVDAVIEECFIIEPQIQQIVDKHRPDVIVIDNLIGSPALVFSGKPWVFLYSAGPLFVLPNERLPPHGSGFPTNGDNTTEEWIERKERNKNYFEKHSIKYNKWLKENGFPTIDKKRCIPDSPYLSLYSYPEEIDYTDIRPLPSNWTRVDSFARKNEQEFIIPDRIKEWIENKEKVIYLTLGSIHSKSVELMKRLVNILSKCEHKIIVSKGRNGDEYELPDNMWGQNTVPQMKILPLVDLVITHGGNNTICETFTYGKPMIVLPIRADQLDNAQRVHEKGFGLRLDPHSCTEEELIGGIHKLLNDNELKNRLNAASKRILSSNPLIEVSKQIENLVKN